MTRKPNPGCVAANLAVLAATAVALVMLSAQSLAAQEPASSPAATPAHKARPHARPRAGQPLTPPVEEQAPAPAPVTPPAPEQPRFPADDQPAQAEVTWDSHGLSIDAANSSLQQILKDFSAATGTKVEGLNSDQRVFGAFGPGLARDVLSQLLQGSGYNVIMIGDQGQGAPRQILLTARHSGDTPAGAGRNGANGGEEDATESDADEQPVPPPQMPMRPGFGPGGPPRTPQQIMQEMQQRQQQMQQRNNPQN